MVSWNYKTIKKKPENLKSHDDLPPGRWLIVSKAARIKGYNPTTIRMKFFRGKISAYRVRKGPMLVNLDEIK